MDVQLEDNMLLSPASEYGGCGKLISPPAPPLPVLACMVYGKAVSTETVIISFILTLKLATLPPAPPPPPPPGGFAPPTLTLPLDPPPLPPPTNSISNNGISISKFAGT